jgi:hypothetical protein
MLCFYFHLLTSDKRNVYVLYCIRLLLHSNETPEIADAIEFSWERRRPRRLDELDELDEVGMVHSAMVEKIR